MENLLLSASIVFPLLAMMATGYLLRRLHVVDGPVVAGMNRVVFYVGIPTLCFSSLYAADLTALSGAGTLLFIAAGIVILFLATLALVPLFSHDNRRRGVLAQGIFRSNDAVFGIPVALALLGEGRIALMMLTVTMTVILFNALGVVSLEIFSGGKGSLLTILVRLVRHPVIIACVLAIAANLLKVPIPAMLLSPVKSFSGMCAPLAFFVLGASLSFQSMHKNRVALAVVTALRLVVLPAVAIAVALLFGYRGEPIAIMLVIFGAPTALTSYPMAAAAGADAELAGEIVATTAAFSMLTMFLFIFVLKSIEVL